MLAEVTWDNIIMVGTAMGLLGGVQVLRERKKNGNGFNKALCDERHKTLDKQHEETQGNFTRVFEKLDSIMERLPQK